MEFPLRSFPLKIKGFGDFMSPDLHERDIEIFVYFFLFYSKISCFMKMDRSIYRSILVKKNCP